LLMEQSFYLRACHTDPFKQSFHLSWTRDRYGPRPKIAGTGIVPIRLFARRIVHHRPGKEWMARILAGSLHPHYWPDQKYPRPVKHGDIDPT
jgi:hypothetical protein